MAIAARQQTTGVRVGGIQVGGGAPVVVQSMTSTDTADAAGTARQCFELANAGSELVRVTVNLPAAAAAVPEIRRRLDDLGCDVPLIGDFRPVNLCREPFNLTEPQEVIAEESGMGEGAFRDRSMALWPTAAVGEALVAAAWRDVG